MCYKYVCFSKFDTTHFVDILYTLYTEDINVNALKNDQKYYNALKNVLLDPKFLQNKKNLADHFGIKDTCYIGHLEKCVNPDTQISYYKKVAMSKDSEEKLLSSLSSKTSEQEKFKNSIAVSEDT